MSSAPHPLGPTPRIESTKPNEMPESSVRHGKSFDDNIEILVDEIVLAAKWGRPSLLLAVHKSKFGQEKAEKQLEARLTKEGMTIARIVVNERRSDIASLIRDAAPGAKRVFFISNIDWGGGEDGKQAYRALNLHRELFVEGAVKAVFWLTMNEAAMLPRLAPDFWAFRHRVVEFISQRAPASVRLPSGILAWDVQRSVDPFESPEGGIRAREELLGRLPNSMEALSARIELYYSIGHLHWSTGDLPKAATAFRAGVELAQGYELPELKSSLLNGIGIIQYEQDDYSGALGSFTQGLRHRSSSSSLLINISAVNCVLGRNHEALATAKRAVRANPMDAETWKRFGYIQNAAGKPDEAILCLLKAAELAPRVPDPPDWLAVLYSLVERPDEARRELERARELAGESESAYRAVLREALLGEPVKSRELLRAAVKTGDIPIHAVRRDPNLCLVFEEAELAELSGSTGRNGRGLRP